MTQEKRRQLNEERLTHQVEVQSRQIERVFSQHHVAARVENGTVQPHAIQFNLQAQLSAGLEKLRTMTNDLIQALRVTDVQLLKADGRWQLQVARPVEPAVPLLDLLALVDTVPPATAVMGLTEAGQPMQAAFDADAGAHLLISGDAGSGKTVLLRSMAVSLALANPQRNLQMIVVSGRAGQGRDWLRPLSFLPHMLEDVVVRTEDAAMVLRFLVDELAYRDEQGIRGPRIVVLIDHIATLIEEGGETVSTAVRRIAQRGAQVGIHLVLATRRPTFEGLDAAMRLSIPMRVVGQMADQKAARVASDGQDVQAGYLLGEGDFVYCTGSRETHFQAAYLGDYDLHMTLSKLREKGKVLLARPFNPRLQLDAVAAPPEPHKPEPADDPAPETARSAPPPPPPPPARRDDDALDFIPFD